MKAFVVLAVVALAAAAPEPPTGGYNKAPQQGGYDDAALSSLGSIDIAQLLAFARSQQRARASAAAPSANYGAPAAGPAARASAPASGYSAPSNAGGYSSSGRNPGGYSSSANQQQSQQSGGYSSSQQSQQSGGYSAPAAPAPAASSGYSAPAPAASSGYSAPAPAASSGYSAPAPAASSGYSAPAPAASSGYAAPAKSSAPASQYGAPGADSCDQATGAGCNGNDGNNGNNGQESSYEQKVHKHVYIHVAPEEPKEAKAPKAPKAPLVPEKHYKILFIRAPTPPPYEQPEIEDLPPAPEQKTLVYVLLKKPDATPAIQLSTPAPTKPSKPEVYFIRYKSPESQDANNAYGAPAGPVVDADAGSSSTDAAASPDAQYGAPARQNGY